MQWSRDLQSRRRAESCASSVEYCSAIETLSATANELKTQVAELLISKQEQDKVNLAILARLDGLLLKSTPQKRSRNHSFFSSPESLSASPGKKGDFTTDKEHAENVGVVQDMTILDAPIPDLFDCSHGLSGVTLWGVIEASSQGQRVITKDKNDKGRVDRTIHFIKTHLGDQFNLLRNDSRPPADRASVEWSNWAKKFKEACIKLQGEALTKLNMFEREAGEKETKSFKLSTFAQSIGKASVKAKSCEAIHLWKSSSSIDVFLVKK